MKNAIPVSVRLIETSTHGRYLVQPSAQAPSPLLVGFHGYMETANLQMDRMCALAGAERWTVVSIQGLHRFYHRRNDEVVASWMTRQDRDLAIADNAAYVSAVVESVVREWDAGGPLVFAGFSQGVAMAFRAACSSPRRVRGLVAIGGDVPPELTAAELQRVGSVLLARGERDEWYSSLKRTDDLTRLHEAGLTVEAPLLDAGHEWTDEFQQLAGTFLERRLV